MRGVKKTLWDNLNELLHEEREVLLQGELARLSQISDRKEELLNTITKELAVDPTAVVPDEVHRHAKRNAELLLQAREGLHIARNRIREMLEVHSGLATYGPRGKRLTIAAAIPSRLEKRS